MPRLRHLTTAVIASLVFSSAAFAKSDFNKMVVFGDSLSDNGNLSLALGATTPTRFTTNPGKVTVEDIAGSLGFTLSPSLAGGSDYAWGGAGINNNSPGTPSSVPTISQQVTAYLSPQAKIDPNALYSMWGGANDIFYQAYQTATGMETSAQAQAGTGAAAQQEVNLLARLQGAGARYIIVFNLPDIGKTPDAAAQNAVSPGSAAALTDLSLLYNGQLNTGLAQLHTGIIPVNVYSLLNELIANPSKYGFTNVTDPACGVGSTSLECGPAGSGMPYTYAAGTNNTYLFADGVHPTTGADRVLTQYVMSEINAPGQISLLAEAPLAASAAHLRTVRMNALQAMDGSSSRLFANVTYGKQTFDATDNTPKTNSSNVNLTIGTVAHAGDHVTLGAALGYSHNNADFSANSGGYKLAALQGTGFIYYHSSAAYVGTYLGFAQLNYNDVQRRFHLGTATRTETGSPTGSQLMAGLLGGWDFHVGTLRTGPFARLGWQKVRVNSYYENNGDSSSMWFGSQTRLSLQETLGWRLRGDWTVGQLLMHPYAALSWTHDPRANARRVQAGLTSMNGNFALTGFIPDQSWASADIGIMTVFNSTASGWIGYQGDFSNSTQKINNFNMGLKINF